MLQPFPIRFQKFAKLKSQRRSKVPFVYCEKYELPQHEIEKHTVFALIGSWKDKSDTRETLILNKISLRKDAKLDLF